MVNMAGGELKLAEELYAEQLREGTPGMGIMDGPVT